MEELFNPKPSEVMQRFSFTSRMRTANETVIEYVAALRRIAADCNLGNQLDENLRDRLVCGVNDCAIQRRLLSESNLDLTKTLAIATAAEATTRHLSHLQATNSEKLTVGHTNAVRVPNCPMPEVEAPFERRLTVELRSVRGVAATRRARVIDAVTKGTSPLTSGVAHAIVFAVTAVKLDTSRKFVAVKADFGRLEKAEQETEYTS